MSKRRMNTLAAALIGLGFTAATTLAYAADLVVIPGDAPGTGFFDPTPVAPVGGNPGTTLGQQRLNVFEAAAKEWSSKLSSKVPITILSFFEPLPCDATGAVLGAAGPISVSRNFPGAGKQNTWYASALANKQAGVDLDPGPTNTGEDLDIVAFFNSELGKPNCLAGSGFYLGLDGKGPANLDDLFSTVLHEFGHGLGFLTLTDEATGQFFAGSPTIYDHFALDTTIGKVWAAMSAAERQQSAVNSRKLVWNGERVTAAAPRVLGKASDAFVFATGLTGLLDIGPAQFGPAFSARDPVFGEVGRVVDQASGLGLACTPLSVNNAAAVKGRIALIDRGSCAFTTKVKNAQLAGAKGVFIADNTPALPPAELFGEDATITIPSARISQADGATLKNALANLRPGQPRPLAILFENTFRLAGADFFGRVQLYTPNPIEPGSSISHWDTLAKPNLLMEPFSTLPPVQAVAPPNDLSRPLMRDIGW